MGILSRRRAAAAKTTTSPREEKKPQHIQASKAEDIPGGGTVTHSSTLFRDTVKVVVEVKGIDVGEDESLALHWGLIRKDGGGGWVSMEGDESSWPKGTSKFGKEALTTILSDGVFEVEIGEKGEWGELRFVVKVIGKGDRWFNKEGGGDFSVGLVKGEVKADGRSGGMSGEEAGKVLLQEESSGHVTLFSRYGTILGVLGDDRSLENEDVMA